MPSKPDSTAPQRAARYEDRMRRQGFVKKHVWIPAKKVPQFEEMVEKLRVEAKPPPDLQEILARLRRHQGELLGEGVERLGIFGSVARGEATAGSDVDLMVTFRPEARIGLFEMSHLRRRLTEMAEYSVDLVVEKSIRDNIRPQAMRDWVEVF